jgi:single-strand selective monofunctional uracil DNA glycosylase
LAPCNPPDLLTGFRGETDKLQHARRDSRFAVDRRHPVNDAGRIAGTITAGTGKGMNLVDIAGELVHEVGRLRFAPPVAYVYNPLDYAWAAHRQYLERYGAAPREILFLGMNPGPWGMAQTGVPFGEVGAVRDWLKIDAVIGRPEHEHPKRPVMGLGCTRSEISGARLWGWARDLFATPERFFSRFFVANYCPLAFLEAGGRNRSPDKLPAAEKTVLLEACDRALRRTVAHLQPKVVIGVGGFAEDRARVTLDGLEVVIGRILHPSPASPAANRGWSDRATRQLREMGVALP